ncbi:flagellar protein FlaG [Herbaspirillum sp. NPDC087042]|uniref:flagellar protein FlaG n=1 Tax=Herbaspirillum sp. NPDC087042 TaxID=3364004 RepID=UPI00381DD210
MSIAPLNSTSAADSSINYPPAQAAANPNPVAPAVAPAASASTTTTSDAPKPTDKQVDHAVSKLNDFAAANASSLSFAKDDTSGKMVIKIMDTETNTLIRQIPSQEAINIAQSIDKLQGLLLKEKA